MTNNVIVNCKLIMIGWSCKRRNAFKVSLCNEFSKTVKASQHFNQYDCKTNYNSSSIVYHEKDMGCAKLFCQVICTWTRSATVALRWQLWSVKASLTACKLACYTSLEELYRPQTMTYTPRLPKKSKYEPKYHLVKFRENTIQASYGFLRGG